jgi:UDP-glucose 4-epimerase
LYSDNRKKFIVTGGCGFVGNHLVKQLLLLKQKTIVIDNFSNSKIKNIRDFYNIHSKYNTYNNIILYNSDIREKDFIDTIFKENPQIDTCIHLAAKISVTDSIKNPTDTMENNLSGTKNMLEASAKHGIKNFIFASSAAVYGNSSNLPLKETEKCKPISPYGLSKLKGEEIVLKYSKSIENTICLRFFNIYGIGQSMEYGGVITKFAESLTNNRPVVIYGDGNQLRDFISIKDVVNAIILSISYHNKNKKQKICGKYSDNIFNVATGKPIKIIDIAKLMIKLSYERKEIKNTLENKEKIIFKEPREGDILQSYADTMKIKELMGFTYGDDIKKGLRDYLRILIKN